MVRRVGILGATPGACPGSLFADMYGRVDESRSSERDVRPLELLRAQHDLLDGVAGTFARQVPTSRPTKIINVCYVKKRCLYRSP